MSTKIDGFINAYFEWLKNKTVLTEVGEWVEVTTPHMDRHNDYLQIYVKKEVDRILLTDDGATIRDLRMSGCDLDTPRRKELLSINTRGFGVRVEGDALVAHASEHNFPSKKHDLIQAMLSVNDLFYLSASNIVSMFAEDVAKWLEAVDIRYTPEVTFAGKSGYKHQFDFVIPASKKEHERIVKTLNRPTKEKAENLIFSWLDIKDVRPVEATPIVILNDLDHNISPNITDALDNYNIARFSWADKGAIQERLAA